MRSIFVAAAVVALGSIGLAGEANAGCIKGAIIGGIAGHLVGHGGLGAAAGCAYGAHESHRYDRQGTGEGRSSYDGSGDGGYGRSKSAY
jgi:hypothetical protein